MLKFQVLTNSRDSCDSQVKLLSKLEKIARSGFSTVFGAIGCEKQHSKSPPKFTHQKVIKLGGAKGGFQGNNTDE